jgi:transcriptional regulator with XRE-family HTH domain
MDALKAEFRRLIEITGWTQSEAARMLGKTPAAINHLVNPDHPNKPSETTLRLFKLLIAGERPELFNARTFELKETNWGAAAAPLNSKERDLIRRLRLLQREDRDRIYSVISALLDAAPKGSGRHAKNKKE